MVLYTHHLGHFQVGRCRYRSLIEGLYTFRSLIDALYSLNSPPVAPFNIRFVSWVAALGFPGFNKGGFGDYPGKGPLLGKPNPYRASCGGSRFNYFVFRV